MNKNTGHPAYIEGYSPQQKQKSRKNLGDYIFRGITHKNDAKHPKMQLVHNPEPAEARERKKAIQRKKGLKEDSDIAYISKAQGRQKVELFEAKKLEGWKLSDVDKDRVSKLLKNKR